MNVESPTAPRAIAEGNSDARRLILFVAIATIHDVWPMNRLLDEPESETEEQSAALFHRIIRSIPEPDRVKVWREVDAILERGGVH